MSDIKSPSAGDAPATSSFELPLKGFKGTPDEIDRQWYEQVYKGRGDSMKQLTLRSLLMGGAIGMVMSVSNLYTTLKLGWSFGISITACVVSFVVWNTIRSLCGSKAFGLVVSVAMLVSVNTVIFLRLGWGFRTFVFAFISDTLIFAISISTSFPFKKILLQDNIPFSNVATPSVIVIIPDSET